MRNLRILPLYLVLVIVPSLVAAADTDKKTDNSKTEAASQKVKDPICGMMVDPKTAEKAKYQGKAYYFCSREERVEFEKNPAKYAKK